MIKRKAEAIIECREILLNQPSIELKTVPKGLTKVGLFILQQIVYFRKDSYFLNFLILYYRNGEEAKRYCQQLRTAAQIDTQCSFLRSVAIQPPQKQIELYLKLRVIVQKTGKKTSSEFMTLKEVKGSNDLWSSVICRLFSSLSQKTAKSLLTEEASRLKIKEMDGSSVWTLCLKILNQGLSYQSDQKIQGNFDFGKSTMQKGSWDHSRRNGKLNSAANNIQELTLVVAEKTSEVRKMIAQQIASLKADLAAMRSDSTLQHPSMRVQKEIVHTAAVIMRNSIRSLTQPSPENENELISSLISFKRKYCSQLSPRNEFDSFNRGQFAKQYRLISLLENEDNQSD